jgi:hypothetical protein
LCQGNWLFNSVSKCWDVVKNIVSGKLVIQFGFEVLTEHLVEGADLA